MKELLAETAARAARYMTGIHSRHVAALGLWGALSPEYAPLLEGVNDYFTLS